MRVPPCTFSVCNRIITKNHSGFIFFAKKIFVRVTSGERRVRGVESSRPDRDKIYMEVDSYFVPIRKGQGLRGKADCGLTSRIYQVALINAADNRSVPIIRASNAKCLHFTACWEVSQALERENRWCGFLFLSQLRCLRLPCGSRITVTASPWGRARCLGNSRASEHSARQSRPPA